MAGTGRAAAQLWPLPRQIVPASGRHVFRPYTVTSQVAVQLVCARCRQRPDLQRGARAGKSRCGQNAAKAVRRGLCDLPSQRAGACEGALQPHALSLPAEALCEQFVIGLGADLLSGDGRCRKTRHQADSRGSKPTAVVDAGILDLVGALFAAPASVGAEPLAFSFPPHCSKISPDLPSFGRLGTLD
jgi:hypothetical protein